MDIYEIKNKIDHRYEILSDCPFCKSTNIVIVLETQDFLNHMPGVFYLSRCNDCSFRFQNPRIKEKYIGTFYPDTTPYYQVTNTEHPDFDAHKQAKKFGINDLKHGKVLEIGCSWGKNLLVFKKIGWATTGIDINKTAVEHANKLDLNVEEISWRKFNTNEKYDLVIESMVLEHVYDSKSLLKKTRGLLKENGILYITIPIYNGSFYLFGKYTHSLHLPAHISFFNKKNITKLLLDQQFSIIKVTPQRVYTDFVKSIENISTNGNGILKILANYLFNNKFLLRILSKAYSVLGRIGFTSRLTIIAKKK